jgi:hypothetical protein
MASDLPVLSKVAVFFSQGMHDHCCGCAAGRQNFTAPDRNEGQG